LTGQRTLRRTGGLGGAATVLAVVVLNGCSTTTDNSPTGRAEAGHARSNRSHGTAMESSMQIEIRVGEERFTATVDDTPAGRDLLAQLPQAVHMRDHGGVEKTGRLQAPLSLDGQPAGADPSVGDLGYYAPGNDLVVYYGDQSYYNGIVILGTFDFQATPRLAELPGDITAHVTVRDS
jgi:hypothetical protein